MRVTRSRERKRERERENIVYESWKYLDGGRFPALLLIVERRTSRVVVHCWRTGCDRRVSTPALWVCELHWKRKPWPNTRSRQNLDHQRKEKTWEEVSAAGVELKETQCVVQFCEKFELPRTKTRIVRVYSLFWVPCELSSRHTKKGSILLKVSLVKRHLLHF